MTIKEAAECLTIAGQGPADVVSVGWFGLRHDLILVAIVTVLSNGFLWILHIKNGAVSLIWKLSSLVLRTRTLPEVAGEGGALIGGEVSVLPTWKGNLLPSGRHAFGRSCCHLGLMFLPQALEDAGGLVDPVGVAGGVVELAGGNRGVEGDIAEFQHDHRVDTKLIRNGRAVAVRCVERFQASVFDAVWEQVGLADEEQHFLRHALR